MSATNNNLSMNKQQTTQLLDDNTPDIIDSSIPSIINSSSSSSIPTIIERKEETEEKEE